MGSARGMTFRHLRLLSTDWKPSPGQKYTDAPKIQCVVTRVTAISVYWQHASPQGKAIGGKYASDRNTFERDYCNA